MCEKIPDILEYILGTSLFCIYIDIKVSDQISCGSVTKPCRSLSFTINNVSRHNDKICLMPAKSSKSDILLKIKLFLSIV